MLNYYGWINVLSILERKEEKKNMNIYGFINSIPDYASNPLTAINVMIMISSLKDKFGDKIHETAREGYLAMQDMSPSKYYKLYLWYWCDECTYGIRECTVKDFNIKEENAMDISKMTKEQALKAIDDLKEYVEKCEEKEKEIPEMQANCLRDVNQCEIKAGLCSNFNRYITFQNQNTNAIWAIMSIELAHLLYAREYLGILDHLTWANWKVDFDIRACGYKVYSYTLTSTLVDTSSIVPKFMWYFDNKDDAQRVCNYMNKYVANVKKNMF